MIAALLAAVVVAAAPASATARGSAAACPRERGRILEQPQPEIPGDAHPTHDRVSFLVDLGSDGRIRRTALIESSGDAAVDSAVAQALARYRFMVPTGGCVSSSTALLRWWTIPSEALPQPSASDAPATSSSPSATAAPSAPACAAPFVRPMGFPLPPRREVPGTVLVDVALDAKAHVSAVRLARSSGNRKTDYAATVAARNGRYVTLPQPGCAPAATTYHLELTFR